MRPSRSARARAAVVVALVTVVAASLGIATRATAQDPPQVWIGPDCEGGAWTCRNAGPVQQVSTGNQDLRIRCTIADCSGLSQQNVSGKNLIECFQDSEVSGVQLTCGTSQTNRSGPNVLDFTQRTMLAYAAFAPILSDAPTQTGTHAVSANQQNGSGLNRIGSSVSSKALQEVVASAASEVQTTSTHTQQFGQAVNVQQNTGVASLMPNNVSQAGNADIFVRQHQQQDSLARALATIQRQNTAGDGNPAPRTSADQDMFVRSDSTNGVLKGDLVQDQELTQTATLPLVDFAGNAVQQQGNGDPVTNATGDYAARMDVDLDSDNTATVNMNQTKHWTQNGIPNQLLGGTVVQDQLDQLALPGGLLRTPHLTTGIQRAFLQNLGDRVCEQDGLLKSKVLASLSQNCNLNGEDFGQEASGETASGALACDGQGTTNNGCSRRETSSTPEEILGEQGLGAGYWQNHLGAWPVQAQPGDRFGDKFSAAERFPALANMTLLEALAQSGGGNTLAGAAGVLAHQAVPALLSAHHDGVDYPRHSSKSPDGVIPRTNTALLGNRNAMLNQAAQFEQFNQLGCNTPDCPPA